MESWDKLTGKTWQDSGITARFSEHPDLDSHGCNQQIRAGSLFRHPASGARHQKVTQPLNPCLSLGCTRRMKSRIAVSTPFFLLSLFFSIWTQRCGDENKTKQEPSTASASLFTTAAPRSRRSSPSSPEPRMPPLRRPPRGGPPPSAPAPRRSHTPPGPPPTRRTARAASPGAAAEPGPGRGGPWLTRRGRAGKLPLPPGSAAGGRAHVRSLRAAPRTLPPSPPPSSLPACLPASPPASCPPAVSLSLPAEVLKLGGWQQSRSARDEPHQPFPGSLSANCTQPGGGG